MSKQVIYDFTVAPDPDRVVDGSDEMLPAAERVTAADLASPLAGGLRDMQMESWDWPPRRPAAWGERPGDDAPPAKDAAE